VASSLRGIKSLGTEVFGSPAGPETAYYVWHRPWNNRLGVKGLEVGDPLGDCRRLRLRRGDAEHRGDQRDGEQPGSPFGR
jgi:hypothetical protein